jgi:hypothetical protein
MTNVVIAQDTWSASGAGSSGIVELPPPKTDVSALIYRGETTSYDPDNYTGITPFQVGQDELLLRYKGQMSHPGLIKPTYGTGLFDIANPLSPLPTRADTPLYKFQYTLPSEETGDGALSGITSTSLEERLITRMTIMYQATTTGVITIKPEFYITNVHNGIVYKSGAIYSTTTYQVETAVQHPSVLDPTFMTSTKPNVALVASVDEFEPDQLQIAPLGLAPALYVGIIDVYMCNFRTVTENWEPEMTLPPVVSVAGDGPGFTIGSWAPLEARITVSEPS